MKIEKELMLEAIDTWGETAQLSQLKEELAELIVAVSHYTRGRPNAVDNLLEEMVDVEIMTAQLKIILESHGHAVDYNMEVMREYKSDKVRTRLKKARVK